MEAIRSQQRSAVWRTYALYEEDGRWVGYGVPADVTCPIAAKRSPAGLDFKCEYHQPRPDCSARRSGTSGRRFSLRHCAACHGLLATSGRLSGAVHRWSPEPTSSSSSSSSMSARPGSRTPCVCRRRHGRGDDEAQIWFTTASAQRNLIATIQVPAAMGGVQGLPVMASRTAVRMLMPCLRAVEM